MVTLNSRFRAGFVASAIVCAASIATTLPAQSRITEIAGTTVATGRVLGVVFDSLSMKPAARASVWIAGGTQSTVADSAGRYELSGVPAGRQFVAFSSASLDSLGLPAQGRSVAVVGDSAQQVELSTPSFRTVWRALCGTTRATAQDSGIVWGTIRDAATLILQSGAAARFNWVETQVTKDKEVSYGVRTHEARTDSTGTYYACGLPADVRVSSEGAGTKAATGSLEYMIGTRRLFRADLLVSTEMVRPVGDSSQLVTDSATLTSWRGSATLTGVLRDEKGRVVPNATVAVLSSDTLALSDANGMFRLNNLPAGTQLVQVRQIGFSPVASLVDLRPAAATSVNLELNRTVELKPVDVRANRVAPVDRLGFEERKRRGFGFFLESSTFRNAPYVPGIVQGLPNVTVRGSAITMQSGIRTCVPSIYLDGIISDIQAVSVRGVDAYRAVEVYPRMSAPTQYQQGICGSILFWTWSAKW